VSAKGKRTGEKIKRKTENPKAGARIRRRVPNTKRKKKKAEIDWIRV